LLQVDAIVVGAVTDYEPYFPPRCTMRVEWYAANTCYHPIPPGYALPWGTPDEEQIPDRLVLESEIAMTRAQLTSTAPKPPAEEIATPAPDGGDASEELGSPSEAVEEEGPLDPQAETPEANENVAVGETSTTVGRLVSGGGPHAAPPGEPHGVWGDRDEGAECIPSRKPVFSHTSTFHGTDSQTVEALESYVSFRRDPRAGGSEAYLHRMSDFISFCCHCHLYEMLSARGGSDETQVVFRCVESR
jgi:hypothetical protein